MNYRHAFHAGNFADVFKHIILTRILLYMQRKDAPYLYLDTHAGVGAYSLQSDEAERTGEWHGGIGALLDGQRTMPKNVGTLLQPYLDAVKAFDRAGADDLATYPGSPRIAHAFRRRQDRLSLIELHPADALSLADEFRGASGVKVHQLDGWQALKAQMPPKERRAVVLIDPPFEDRAEFTAMLNGVSEALKRFGTGTYCLWYPIKNRLAVGNFRTGLVQMGVPVLDCRIMIRNSKRPTEPETLDGCGMAIINPPYILADELQEFMPWLTAVLEADKGQGTWSADRIEP